MASKCLTAVRLHNVGRWFIEMVVDGHVHVHGSNARFVGWAFFFTSSHRKI